MAVAKKEVRLQRRPEKDFNFNESPAQAVASKRCESQISSRTWCPPPPQGCHPIGWPGRAPRSTRAQCPPGCLTGGADGCVSKTVTLFTCTKYLWPLCPESLALSPSSHLCWPLARREKKPLRQLVRLLLLLQLLKRENPHLLVPKLSSNFGIGEDDKRRER